MHATSTTHSTSNTENVSGFNHGMLDSISFHALPAGLGRCVLLLWPQHSVLHLQYEMEYSWLDESSSECCREFLGTITNSSDS